MQYYTVNSNEGETIHLNDKFITFGFGLTVESSDRPYECNENAINNLFDINVKFTTMQDSKKKDSFNIETHNCQKRTDFPEQFSESLYKNLKCINREYTPNGIFTDKEFSYYTISVAARSPNYYSDAIKIEEKLAKCDCKLQFYYTDIEVDFNNKANPFRIFLNSMFLQLNPTLIQKKNIYYMNYHLTDDDSIIRFGNGGGKEEIRTGLSRVEDYATYKGANGRYNWYEDYQYYSKIYIRADNKKIDIKRKYQDFMEFYADNSGLLLSIFWILGVIFAYYDRVVTNHSISKKLFYFEGIKDNQFKEFKLIKNLIKEKEEFEKKHNKDGQGSHVSTYGVKVVEINTRDRMLNNNFFPSDTSASFHPKNKEKSKGIIDEKDLIDYSSYNIFDMIKGFKIFCCKTKKTEIKANLLEQAKEIIFTKLDVIYYIRNMILFEKINEIYYSENKAILDFLSRPIIYIDETKGEQKPKKDKINKKLNRKNSKIRINLYVDGDLYRTEYILNYDGLNENITNLIYKEENIENKNKLINCLKTHLKGIE